MCSVGLLITIRAVLKKVLIGACSVVSRVSVLMQLCVVICGVTVLWVLLSVVVSVDLVLVLSCVVLTWVVILRFPLLVRCRTPLTCPPVVVSVLVLGWAVNTVMVWTCVLKLIRSDGVIVVIVLKGLRLTFRLVQQLCSWLRTKVCSLVISVAGLVGGRVPVPLALGCVWVTVLVRPSVRLMVLVSVLLRLSLSLFLSSACVSFSVPWCSEHGLPPLAGCTLTVNRLVSALSPLVMVSMWLSGEVVTGVLVVCGVQSLLTVIVILGLTFRVRVQRWFTAFRSLGNLLITCATRLYPVSVVVWAVSVLLVLIWPVTMWESLVIW